MWGFKETILLKAGSEGVVRLGEDAVTNSCSIGLRTKSKVHWKPISQELHDLLVKELGEN